MKGEGGVVLFNLELFCWMACVVRPLHIAVVQGDVKVIDQLLSVMLSINAPVDHFNQQRQVNTVQ